MEAMAKALLDWETIDAEQIDDIMAGKPPRPPKALTPSDTPDSSTPPPSSGLSSAGGSTATTPV
jgi:cell division protease FtsH